MDDKIYKYWKTGLLCYTYMCAGITWSIIGPTIPDLCRRMDITPEQIGLALSANSFSWMAGTIVFGILLDRFLSKYDLFVFGGLLCTGSALVVMPQTTHLWVYALCSVITGLAGSVVELVCSALVLTLWGIEADRPMFLVHFFWTVGSIVTPLYVRPFLGTTEDINGTAANVNLHIFNPQDEIRPSRIEISYTIAGCICVMGGLLSLVSFIARPPTELHQESHKRSSFKDTLNLAKLTETSTKFAWIMCILLFIFFFFLNGAWGTAFSWMYTYAIESDLHFTTQEASTLDFANKLSYGIGYVIYGGVLLRFFSIQKLFMGGTVSSLLLTLGLATFGTDNKLSLYIVSCTFWVAIVPMWAGSFAFLDKYLVVTATVAMFANVGASMSGFVFSWLAGWIFTYHEPEDVFWLIFGCMAATSGIVVIMQIIAMKRGSRFDKVDTMNVTVEEMGFDNNCKPNNGEVTVIKPTDMLPTNDYENNDIRCFEHSTHI